MKKIVSTVCIFMFSLSCMSLLSSCALNAVSLPPLKTYTLTSAPSPQPVSTAPSISGALAVSPVVALPGFEGRDMIYQSRPYQLAAFSNHAWFAPPASMITPLIVSSLQASHIFSALFLGEPSQADYVLNTTLVSLYQDFTVQPSQMVLNLNITLINAKTGAILIADQSIHEQCVTQDNTPYSGVLAANIALSHALSDIQITIKNGIKNKN